MVIWVRTGEGSAQGNETELQGKEHSEKDTYYDDLGGEIRETMKEDLSHGMHKLQLEKLAIFE